MVHSHNSHKSDLNPLRMIGQAYRLFGRIVDAPLRELGFAMSQMPVLGSLARMQALSQAELARIAQVEQSSMAQLLVRMERDGLVQRVPDPADKRSRLISLTPHAIKSLPQGRAVMDDVKSKALTGFSEDEIKQLTDLVARLQFNLEQAVVSAGTSID